MTKRYNSHHIKLLFLVLILLIAVFSCKRNKNTGQNDTEGGIPALGASDNYQEQGQYDDESDFEVKIIEGAFENCGLISVTFGENVKEIGDSAFENNNLKNVIIGKNVAVIGEWAFWGPVKSITIPRDLNLRNEAFSNDFEKFYNDNGKKEGTYLWDGENWKMKK